MCGSLQKCTSWIRADKKCSSRLSLLWVERFISRVKAYIAQNALTSLIIHNRQSGKFKCERELNGPE